MGSTPIGRANFKKQSNILLREVAQLGRALGLGPRGRRFESCLPDHFFDLQFNNINGGVAQLARAFGSYPKGRGFDSLRRYHLLLKLFSEVYSTVCFTKKFFYFNNSFKFLIYSLSKDKLFLVNQIYISILCNLV